MDKYPDTDYAIDALFNLAAHYADSGSAPRANAVLDDLNPTAPRFAVSARTGEGMDAWCDWLRREIKNWKEG